MLSWEHKRSPRILALDARREHEENKRNKGKEACDQLQSKRACRRGSSKSKPERKRVRTRPVKELVDQRVQKGSILETEEDGASAAENQVLDISATAGMLPEKSKLELLLGKLQKRDSHGFFANPVDPDEVEFYYEVITEPMDFGTISSKLKEGSYKTLQDFERDVFLVFSNAMLFNASNTIYYRQACTLKELALKLFRALKTDPDNFGTEVSLKRPGPGRRTKTEVLLQNTISSSKTTGTETASKGIKGKGKSAYPEVDRRQTYRPWSSFPGDDESTVSMFYKESRSLEREETNHAGYLGSLSQFAKDLGPAAQRVARSKAERCITEAIRLANTASNQQLHAPKDQIPCAGTPRQNDIATASSLKLHKHSAGSRRFLDGYSGIRIDSLNGEKVSAAGMIDGCYDLIKEVGHPCVGVDCASTSYETPQYSKGKNILVGENSQAGKITETCGDFQRENVIRTNSEVLGIKLGSSFRISADADEAIDFSSQWKRNSSPNRIFLSNMMGGALNVDKPVQTTDASSSQSRISHSISLGYGSASSSSLQQLCRASEVSSRSQPMGKMNTAFGQEKQHARIWAENGHHGYRDHLKQGDKVLEYSKLAELESQSNFNHWLRQKSRSEITNLSSQAGPSNQQGIAAEEEIHSWFKPLRMGSKPLVIDGFKQQSNSSDGWLQQKSRSAGYNTSGQAGPSYQQTGAVKPTSGERLCLIQRIAVEGGSPIYLANSDEGNRVADWFKPAESRLQAMVDSCVQQKSKPPGGWHQQNARYDGTVLSGQAGPSHQQGWVVNPSFGKGLYQVQGTGQQESPSSERNLDHGRQLSTNWLKPTELKSQQMVHVPFRQQPRPSEVLSDQAATSRRQPQLGWTITHSYEQATSTSNAYDFEMCQTQRQRELRTGAPSDNFQKQPFTDVNLLKWLLEN